MKIGEFASHCGVSQSTVRFYIKNGLLLPDESGCQYNFSDREVRDLQTILRLKELQFSMSEIAYYMSTIRNSNLVEPDVIEELTAFLMQKQEALTEEKERLDHSIRSINQEMISLRSRVVEKQTVSGVPLSALPLLVCPHCGRRLSVNQAEISDGFLTRGELHCPGEKKDCPAGYTASIRDGILHTGNLYTGSHDRPDLKRGMYRNNPPEFSRPLMHCHDYLTEKLRKEDLHHKVLLEANINGYFYFYRHLDLLPQDCLLIVVDKYPEMLEMYKSLIDCLDVRCKILYIADAGTDYPLKNSCVDLHISYFGENEYQLYHPECFLQDALHFFRPDARLFGSYLSYRPSAKSRQNLMKKYPEGYSRRIQMQYLIEDYQKLGFSVQTVQQGAIDLPPHMGYSFACHQPGETMEIYSYSAFRKV